MSTLITNARIFDGESPTLIEGMDVLLEDNKISTVTDGTDRTTGWRRRWG